MIKDYHFALFYVFHLFIFPSFFCLLLDQVFFCVIPFFSPLLGYLLQLFCYSTVCFKVYSLYLQFNHNLISSDITPAKEPYIILLFYPSWPLLLLGILFMHVVNPTIYCYYFCLNSWLS